MEEEEEEEEKRRPLERKAEARATAVVEVKVDEVERRQSDTSDIGMDFGRNIFAGAFHLPLWQLPSFFLSRRDSGTLSRD